MEIPPGYILSSFDAYKRPCNSLLTPTLSLASILVLLFSLKIEIMSSKSFPTLTLFPLLPPELRLKIWRTVAAQPHTLELSCSTTNADGPQGQWFSHSQAPAIFSVCSESRAAALPLFTVLAFSDGQIGMPCRKPLYINFEVGTLCLGPDLHSKWAEDLLIKNEQLKENLKYLVISLQLWRAINPVYLDPGWDGGNVWPQLKVLTSRGVERSLKALQDVELRS